MTAYNMVIALSYVLVGVMGSCLPKTGMQKQVREVECRLEIEKSKCVLGGTIVLNTYMRNNTDKRITICAWPSIEEMVFTHFEEGKQVSKKDKAIYHKPASAKESFLVIEPGYEIYYGTVEFDKKYFDKVGAWELKILRTYDFTGEDLGLNGWKGKVQSNVVSVDIVAPPPTSVPPQVPPK